MHGGTRNKRNCWRKIINYGHGVKPICSGVDYTWKKIWFERLYLGLVL